jgi:6-phosphofructokinase
MIKKLRRRGKAMNKLGILTSGGDAPGMNTAIRAVVAAQKKNVEVVRS